MTKDQLLAAIQNAPGNAEVCVQSGNDLLGIGEVELSHAEDPPQIILKDEFMVDTLLRMQFEERGWEDAFYPKTKVYAWRKEGIGLLIESDDDDKAWAILA